MASERDAGGTIVSGGGSVLTVLHTERRVKTFLVLEPEMQSLSWLNTGAVFFFSLASACFSFGMDWFRDWRASITTAEAADALTFLAILWAAAGVGVVVGVALLFARRTMITRIREESAQRLAG